MRTLTAVLGIAMSSATLVSCVKTNAFKCDGDSAACGTGGQCEADGFCSIASDRCGAGGREYSDTAGDLSGTCVGGGPQPDGPQPDGPDTDAPPTDGPGDSSSACTGYAAIAGGTSGHLYMNVTTPDVWIDQQNNVCNTSGGYTAIPDDALELAAIFTASGATTRIWLGVSDRLNEGTFLDTKNQPYTAITLTGNSNNNDCATTDTGAGSLDIRDCDGAQQLNLPTVCECEP